jgi:tetratricopeptide (TPR) repeat protein
MTKRRFGMIVRSRWLTIIVVVVITGALVLMAMRLWGPGPAAAVVASVGLVARIWIERFERDEVRREERSQAVLSCCVLTGDGRLPRISDITDLTLLGVHPAPAEGAASLGMPRMPPYVNRDVDALLRRRMATAGFVLLVGDSTAGKTRTVAEAVATALPAHTLIAPVGREGLAEAVSFAARRHASVLWLDDIEGYFGPGGLNRAMIGRVINGTGHHRVVVATLRAAEMARYTEGPTVTDDAARQLQRDAREVLGLAHPIRIDRMFSPPERDRAKRHAGDSRIQDALAHADSYGLAEYLASGPELLRDWDNAWEPGTYPRGAALVAAAIDCRRAGHTGPLSRRLLEELSVLHLARRGKVADSAEPSGSAWEWATRVRRSTASLIDGNDETGYEVFDYLVDTVQHRMGREPIPDEVMSIILRHASPADAANVGFVAYEQRRYAMAARALRQALEKMSGGLGPDHPDTLAIRHGLALVLYGRGRYAEAEAEHRAVAAARARVLGASHAATLISRDYHALALNELGRRREAEAIFRAVHEQRLRGLGPAHPHTLRSRTYLAYAAWSAGRVREAEAEHEAIWRLRARILGAEHPHTLISRDYRAMALRALGRPDEAEAEHRAVIEARVRVLGADHPYTLASRHNRAIALHDLGRIPEAVREHQEVFEARSRILGSDHPHTLASWNNLVDCLDGSH